MTNLVLNTAGLLSPVVRAVLGPDQIWSLGQVPSSTDERTSENLVTYMRIESTQVQEEMKVCLIDKEVEDLRRAAVSCYVDA